MDKDCMFSHGISSTISEKMYDNSDAYEMVYCKLCGYRADSNIMT
jgi:DNA-directed RNA polymerase beta subunit